MTAPLAKAILLRLKQIPGSGKNAPTRVVPEDNGAFAVQFNPTSLKISRQNNIDEGGATTHTQRRVSPSQKSATLSFDLEFDTAEGDEAGNPVDVRTKTLIVRQFAEPTKEKPKEPPPPIRFIWGTFVFTGIVTQVTEDLDYFSSDGKPLRAKVSVTITEQNPDFEAKLVGASARDAQSAAAPGGGSGGGSGPGAKPVANPTSAALAQAGESLQQLLSRLEADPATWRAAMAGLDSPLALTAGAQIQIGAQVSAGAGFGVSAGFAAGGELASAASLSGALAVSGGGVAAGSGEVAAGFALAEGGGVSASLNTVASASAQASVAQARGSFDVPSVSIAIAPAADPRSASYGNGVPLRPRPGDGGATRG